MTTARTIERDGSRPNPPVLGALAYLLLNLPLGIAGFVFVVVTMSVGISTAIIWVGVGILAVALLAYRGLATLERLRVQALLGTYIAMPYRPLAEGRRWRGRVADPATWKDLVYLVLLLPIGIAEFTIMISSWTLSLGYLLLPIYYRWLPGGSYRLWDWDRPVMVVDSTLEALPFAALGALLLAVTVVVTKGLGILHARYARAMLGPSGRRIDRLAELDTAGVIDWSTGPGSGSTANLSFRPVP
jgi:putative sensor protein